MSLDGGSGSHAVQASRVMTAFEPLAAELRPDVVVVVGDVNSTMACALVAAKSGAMLAHVEAGLRSRDWSMPEEVNRVVIDRVSDYLFAPSPDAVANLRAEGYRDDQVYLVGNVMADTLLANLDRAAGGDTLARLGLEPGQYGLVTLHRPANVDDPATLAALLCALRDVSRLCALVLPAHPRAAGALRDAGLGGAVRVIPPAGYLDFIALQASARLVLTDSGGVQEESTVLGVPVPHPPREHRTSYHRHGRHQPGGGTRPRPDSRGGPPGPRSSPVSPEAGPVGWPRRGTHRSRTAGREGHGPAASHGPAGCGGPDDSRASADGRGPVKVPAHATAAVSGGHGYATGRRLRQGVSLDP